MNHQIQTVPFHGQTLSVIPQQDKLLVAVKPICENIGVDWSSQNKRIKRDEVLNSVMVMMTTTATDGKNYKYTCLPLEFINGWLFGIDTNRIKDPAVKARVIEYQRECYQALFQYWTQGEAVNPRGKPSDVADRKALNIAVRSLANARAEHGKQADFAGVWRIVHGYLGVESISDATTAQVQQALTFVQKAIEGEYLPAQDTDPVLAATEENKRKAAISVDMFSRVARHRWYELDKLTERQRHLIRQQEQLARQQSDLIAEQHQLEQQLSAIKTNLYDPLFEASHQLRTITGRAIADDTSVERFIKRQDAYRR